MSKYLIAYNNTQGFDSSKIHQVITTIPVVNDWWHYLPNLYIVSTTRNAKYIADKIIPHFQGLLFLVIGLDMRDYNGVLNKDAWEWIRKKNNQNLKFRVIPKPSTSGLPPSLSSLLLPSKPPVLKPITLEDFLGLKR